MGRIQVCDSFVLLLSLLFLADDQHNLWLFLAAAGLHEGGHYFALRCVGGKLIDLRLSAAGGVRRNFAFTKAAELVRGWIDDEGKASPFRHDGSPALRTHTHNARARANQWGTSLGKVNRDSDKLVDLAVSMVGAVLGARDALNSGRARTAPRRAPRRLY